MKAYFLIPCAHALSYNIVMQVTVQKVFFSCLGKYAVSLQAPLLASACLLQPPKDAKVKVHFESYY